MRTHRPSGQGSSACVRRLAIGGSRGVGGRIPAGIHRPSGQGSCACVRKIRLFSGRDRPRLDHQDHALEGHAAAGAVALDHLDGSDQTFRAFTLDDPKNDRLQ